MVDIITGKNKAQVEVIKIAILQYLSVAYGLGKIVQLIVLVVERGLEYEEVIRFFQAGSQSNAGTIGDLVAGNFPVAIQSLVA